MRGIRSVLVLSFFLTLAAAVLYPARHTNREFWEETLTTADRKGFPYGDTVRSARRGVPAALRRILDFSRHTDAAGSLGHGVALVSILTSMGDPAFASAILEQPKALRLRLRQLLLAGLDYGPGGHRPEDLAILHPLSFDATQ